MKNLDLENIFNDHLKKTGKENVDDFTKTSLKNTFMAGMMHCVILLYEGSTIKEISDKLKEMP